MRSIGIKLRPFKFLLTYYDIVWRPWIFFKVQTWKSPPKNNKCFRLQPGLEQFLPGLNLTKFPGFTWILLYRYNSQIVRFAVSIEIKTFALGSRIQDMVLLDEPKIELECLKCELVIVFLASNNLHNHGGQN